MIIGHVGFGALSLPGGLIVPEVRHTDTEEPAVADDATPFPPIHKRVFCAPHRPAVMAPSAALYPAGPDGQFGLIAAQHDADIGWWRNQYPVCARRDRRCRP
jgi:hypothetical protein